MAIKITGTTVIDDSKNITNVVNITSTGTLSAITKSFLIPHPTKEGKLLRYGSLEGPENGVYVRGRLTGSSIIYLPDYWINLIDYNSITVSVTAIGRSQDIYVVKIEDNCIIVNSDNIDCFYVVFAERNDVDKLVVEPE